VSHAIGADGALARDTSRFDFFQALRLIEAAYPERAGLGRSLRPADDAVRLGQKPRLGFAAVELAEYRPAVDGRPGRLTLNAGGLFGANGPMPLYFTEYAHNRMLHEADTTLVGFLDMFHHRQLSLFYRAWAMSQPVVGLDRGRPLVEGYGRYVGSLCGQAAQAAAGQDSTDDPDTLQFCGLLATRTRHASGLGLLLSQYFSVPVAIRQFVGQWLKLSGQDQTTLQGHGKRPLGAGLVVGKRVWDRQSKFRVVIGPVGKTDIRRLLPGTASHRRLIEWVDLYTGGLLDWDVELRVQPDAASGMRFDGSARLAHTSWLGSRRIAGGGHCIVRIQPRRNVLNTR
jgi:type VI secretion system protein ImpH